MATNYQKVLNDFIATIEKKPNATTDELLAAFPEFNGDKKLLQSAYDYNATIKSGKAKTYDEVNSKFPEFFTPQRDYKNQDNIVQYAIEDYVQTDSGKKLFNDYNTAISSGVKQDLAWKDFSDAANKDSSFVNIYDNMLYEHDKANGRNAELNKIKRNFSWNTEQISEEDIKRKKELSEKLAKQQDKEVEETKAILNKRQKWFSFNPNPAAVGSESGQLSVHGENALKSNVKGQFFLTDEGKELAALNKKIADATLGETWHSTNAAIDSLSKKDGLNENDERALEYAKKFQLATEMLRDAPSESDPKAFEDYWEGLKSKFGKEIIPFWGSIAELKENKFLKEVIERGKEGTPFTEAEKAMLNAYISMGQMSSIRNDISIPYLAGQGTMESLPYMAEFIATSLIGGGLLKGASMLAKAGNAAKVANMLNIINKGMDIGSKATALEKIGAGAANVGLGLGKAAVQTAALPSTYANISEDRLNYALNDRDYGFSGWMRSFGDSMTEVASERIGGAITSGTSKLFGKKGGWWYNFSHTPFGKVVNDPLGITETGEEYIGAGMNWVRSYIPFGNDEATLERRGEAEQMFTKKQLATTWLSMLPMSLFGNATNAGVFIKNAKKYNEGRDALSALLQAEGFSNQDANAILSRVENAENSTEFAMNIEVLRENIINKHNENNQNIKYADFGSYVKNLNSTLKRYAEGAAQTNLDIQDLSRNYDKLSEEEKIKVDKIFSSWGGAIKNQQLAEQASKEKIEVPSVEIVLEEQEKQADTPSPIVSSTPTSSGTVSIPEIDTEAEVAKANATFGKASNKDGNLYEVSAFVNGKNVEGALKGEVALTEDGKLDIENSKGLMFIPKGNGKYTSKAIPLTDTEYNSVTINNVFNKEQYAEQAVNNAKQAAQAVSLNELIKQTLQAQATPESAENGVSETSSNADVGVTDNAVENQVSYPTKKDGSIDYDNLTPEQEYSLTAQEYGEDVAQEDVKSYIEQYQSAIDNIQSQLDSKNGTNNRAKMREAMRKNQEKLEAWKALLKEEVAEQQEVEPVVEENALPNDVKIELGNPVEEINALPKDVKTEDVNNQIGENNEMVAEGENAPLAEISNDERAEMEARIVDWLSEENLERAEGKTREEIFDEFGNELEPIAYIPKQYISLVSADLKDQRIYCGKGYFIDHALRNHAKDGKQLNVEDVDVSKYLNIQSVLDNPDSVKETYIDGKRTVVFIKKIGRYFAELTQVEEDGKIVLHKSMFNQKKEPYAKLNDIRSKGTSSEGGVSSISHTAEAAPAISLESRGDVISNSNVSSASEDTNIVPEKQEKIVESDENNNQTPEEVVQQAAIDTAEKRADEATADAVNKGTYISQPYTELGKAEKDFHLLLQKYNIKNPREKVTSSNFLNAVTEKIKKLLPEAQREIMYVAVEYKKLSVDTKIQEQLGGRLMHIKNDKWEERKNQSDEIIEKARVVNNELLDFMRDNNDLSYEDLLITGPSNGAEYKKLSDVNKELSRKVINIQDEYFTLSNRLKEDIKVREKSSSKQKEKPTRIKYYVKNKQGDFVEAWAGKEITKAGGYSLFKAETGQERHSVRTRDNIYSVNENGEYVSLKPQEAKSEVEKRTVIIKKEFKISDISEVTVGLIKKIVNGEVGSVSELKEIIKSLKSKITYLCKKIGESEFSDDIKGYLLSELDSAYFLAEQNNTDGEQKKPTQVEGKIAEALSKIRTTAQQKKGVRTYVTQKGETKDRKNETFETIDDLLANNKQIAENIQETLDILHNIIIETEATLKVKNEVPMYSTGETEGAEPISAKKALTSISNLISRLNLQGRVQVAMNLEQLKKINKQAYEAEMNGEHVNGFYIPSKHQIVLYVPNLLQKGVAEEVVFHEGIAHFGLRELFGEEEFNNFCKQVWKVMSYAERKEMMKYLGKKYGWNQKVSEEDMLAAADEYVAHLAQTPAFVEYLKNRNEQEAVSWMNKKWKKVCDLIRKIFKKQTSVDIMSNEEKIMDALYRSYQLLGSEEYATFSYYRSLAEQMRKDDVKVGEINEGELFSKVYHGSGASFDRFDHSHIGEGVGVQAFGWGTYVTDVENVGRGYAQNNDSYSGGHHLYTVEIPDDNGSNYLSWEGPVAIEVVDKVLDELYQKLVKEDKNGKYTGEEGARNRRRLYSIRNAYIKGLDHGTGRFLYNMCAYFLESYEAASQFLNKQGLVGISYPAEEMTEGVTDNSRNYVIFNENDAQIEEHIRFSKKPRRLLINEDLGIDEKIAIKKYIESLPENIDYSHPLSFLNNDYIYIFNTNLGLYEDNIKDGDGFEILRKYNINKLTNGRRKEIKRLTGDIYTSNGKDGEFRGKRDGTIGGGLHTSRTGTAVQIDGVDIKKNENEQIGGRGNIGKSNVDWGRINEINTPEGETPLFSKGKPAGYVNLSSEMFKGRRPILSVLEAKDTAILNASKKWFESVLGEGNLVTDNHVSRDVYTKALQDGRSMRVLYSGKTDGEYDIVGFELDGVHYLDFNNMTSEMMMYELGSVWVNRLKANTELWEKVKEKSRQTDYYKKLTSYSAYKNGEISEEDIIKEVVSAEIGKMGGRLVDNASKKGDVEDVLKNEMSFIFDDLQKAINEFVDSEQSEVSLKDLATASISDIVNNTSLADEVNLEEAIEELTVRNLTYGQYEMSDNESVEEYIDRIEKKFNSKILLNMFGKNIPVPISRYMFSRSAWADADLPIAVMQRAIEGETGKPLPEALDVYNKIPLINSKASFRMKNIGNDIIIPLTKKKKGYDEILDPVTFKEKGKEINASAFECYMLAKDIIESQRMYGIDRGRNPLEELLGVTLEQYVGYVEGRLGRTAIENFWQGCRKLTDTQLDLLLEIGSISIADKANMKRDFYVPSKGFIDDAIKDVTKKESVNLSKSLNANHAHDIKKSVGRYDSIADSPFYSIQKSIYGLTIEAEKTNVTDAFVGLIKYAELYGVDLSHFINTEGGVLKDKAEGEHSIKVRTESGDKYLVFNEKTNLGRKMGEALNPEPLGERLAEWKSFFSKMHTGYNPSFIAKNYFRDKQQTITAAQKKYGITIAMDTYKNTMTKAIWDSISGYLKGAKDFGSGEYDAMVKEFFESGAATGYMEFRDESTMRKAAKGEKSTIEKDNFMERIANLSEALPRFALYKAMRDNGYSQFSAVMAARNATINFGRRAGSKAARYLGAVIPFFNAGTLAGESYLRFLIEKGYDQSTMQAALRLTLSLTPYIMAGAFIAMGDDDNDDSLFRIDEWLGVERFYLGGVVPANLPQSLAPFAKLGYNIVKSMNNEKELTHVLYEAVGDFLGVTFLSNQIGQAVIDELVYAAKNGKMSGDGFARITGTALGSYFGYFSPLIQVSTNINSFGRPITYKGNNGKLKSSGKANYLFRLIADSNNDKWLNSDQLEHIVYEYLPPLEYILEPIAYGIEVAATDKEFDIKEALKEQPFISKTLYNQPKTWAEKLERQIKDAEKIDRKISNLTDEEIDEIKRERGWSRGMKKETVKNKLRREYFGRPLKNEIKDWERTLKSGNEKRIKSEVVGNKKEMHEIEIELYGN